MAHAICHKLLIIKAQVRSRVTPSEICVPSQTLKREAAFSCKVLVSTYQTTWCHNTEYHNMHNTPHPHPSPPCDKLRNSPAIDDGILFAISEVFLWTVLTLYPILHGRISSLYFMVKLDVHFFQISQAHYVPRLFLLRDKVSLLSK
jgi:hypothetical protein